MKHTFLILAGAALLVSAQPARSSQPSGNAIILSSTLLTVEPHERTAVVQVSNHTAEAQRYRTSFIDMVMGADGRLSMPKAKEHRAAYSASSWLIATPRSFALAPGETQTIRLLVRRPAGLAEGDYRAHLRIAQEPPPSSGGGLAPDASDADMRFEIATVYSVSIPVTVRHGRPTVSMRLADAHLVGPDRLAVTIERAGTGSFRGYAHVSSGSLSTQLPITIYRELRQVTLTFDLQELAGVDAPLSLALHAGDAPRGRRPAEAPPLSTFSLSR